MSSFVQVTVDGSAFPETVREDLLKSLHLRQMDHKLHYDSVKQAQRWLALHEAYSPTRTDPDCVVTYENGFRAAAERLDRAKVHLVGLGCGGGEKDTRLLEILRGCGTRASYTPCDASLALALVAFRTAVRVIPESHCFPVVCDLARTEDLGALIEAPFARFQVNPDPEHSTASNAQTPGRLLTFFGLIPNFHPDQILPKVRGWLRPADYLLLSANLSPGPDYDVGVRRVLPQYDNDLTREWLLTCLLDLGIEREDGQLRVVIEQQPNVTNLKRIAVYFDFLNPRCIQIGQEKFAFIPGDSIRLFFSYRYTPHLVQELLAPCGLEILDQWITSSEEEGVFLVRAKA